jgi:hypothetical protein
MVGKARTPATASVAGPRPPCGVHSAVPPSCPAVQRPAPSGVQRVRCPPVRCPPVRCPPVWCPPVQRPAGCCPPRSVRTRPSRPTLGGGVGDQVAAAGSRHHRNGSSPGGLPRRGATRSTAGQARTRAMLPGSRVVSGVGGGPGPGWVRARPRVTAGEPGRPGRRAEHPSLTAALWAGSRLRREVAAAAAWLRSWAGWATTVGGGDGACCPGGRGPEGPEGVPAGMGVRPQRGPGWQRALPARCRHRCDLREWLVGLPGLEPGTSS